MKFMFTASSISSIAMSRMMTFLRFRKIPTMLIANSTAPSVRKCDSESKRRLPFLLQLVVLLRQHRDQPHPARALHRGLPGRVLVLRVLAFSQGERDRHDDRHEQQYRRQLDRVGIVRVQEAPELLGVA